MESIGSEEAGLMKPDNVARAYGLWDSLGKIETDDKTDPALKSKGEALGSI